MFSGNGYSLIFYPFYRCKFPSRPLQLIWGHWSTILPKCCHKQLVVANSTIILSRTLSGNSTKKCKKENSYVHLIGTACLDFHGASPSGIFMQFLRENKLNVAFEINWFTYQSKMTTIRSKKKFETLNCVAFAPCKQSISLIHFLVSLIAWSDPGQSCKNHYRRRHCFKVLRSKSSSVLTVAMSPSNNFFRIVRGTVELVTILIESSSSSLALLLSARAVSKWAKALRYCAAFILSCWLRNDPGGLTSEH